MSTEFKLPQLGEGVESAEVSQIYVSEGDTIEADDSVMELETEKAVTDLPCPHAGTIAKIHVAEGDTVAVGQMVLTLEDGQPDQEQDHEQGQGEAVTQQPPSEKQQEGAQQPKEKETQQTEPKANEAAEDEEEEEDTPAQKESEAADDQDPGKDRSSSKPVASQDQTGSKEPESDEQHSDKQGSDKQGSEEQGSDEAAAGKPEAEKQGGQKAAAQKSDVEQELPLPAGPATRRLAQTGDRSACDPRQWKGWSHHAGRCRGGPRHTAVWWWSAVGKSALARLPAVWTGRATEARHDRSHGDGAFDNILEPCSSRHAARPGRHHPSGSGSTAYLRRKTTRHPRSRSRPSRSKR